jgi:hypothetical protein
MESGVACGGLLRVDWRENFSKLASVISGGTCQKENRNATRKCLFGGTAGCAAESCCGKGNGKDARGDVSRTRKVVSQSAGLPERKATALEGKRLCAGPFYLAVRDRLDDLLSAIDWAEANLPKR